jgi:hypothetical protein
MAAPPDLANPTYLNQYATDTLGLSILSGDEPADPDDTVLVEMADTVSGYLVFARPAERQSAGLYEITLTPTESGTIGHYTLTWSYQLSGEQQTFVTYLAIGTYSETYARLSEEMRAIVENVWLRWADQIDSPAGGPNLQSYYQSRFNRGRVADMLGIAVGRLNTVAQPFQTYSLENFPIGHWGSLLEQACQVEVIRHLRRSYLEQPLFEGGQITRHDRRDYFDRYGQLLQEEEGTLQKQLEVFKIRSMTLGRPKVLVSGGVWGRYGPVRYSAGRAAARGYHMWMQRI